MRNAALIVAALFAVLVVLAVAVPALVDWSRYKGEITARAEAATGRQVTISGPVSLRLLPSPAFSAEGIAIGNPPAARTDQPMATAETLRLKLALLPLLTGKARVTSLELDRPVVRLARMPDGRPNWSFGDESAKPTPPEKPHATNAEPPALPAEDERLPVEKVAIRNGSVSYDGGSGQPLVIGDLDTDVALGGRAGPFHATGTARVAGTPLAFDAAMDRLAAGRGSPASLSLKLPDDDARLEFSGLFTQLSSGDSLRGRLTLSAPDLAGTLGRLGMTAPLPTGTPLAVDTEIVASAEEVAASNLEARLGETRATGAVTANLTGRKQIDVRLAVPALDLDQWQKPVPAKGSAPAQTERKQEQAAPQRPRGDEAFALPADVFVTAALSVDALSWRGQTVREAVVEAALDNGEVMVNKASAVLPGGSTIAADGTLVAEKGRAVFEGNARLHSDNLRTLLAWVGAEPDGLPEAALRSLDFTSPLRATETELRLSDFRLKLDRSAARGTLSARLAERPAFTLDASMDSLDLDAYGGKSPRPEPARTSGEAKTAAAKKDAPAAQTPLNALADFDADVKLRLQRLVVNEVTAEAVVVDTVLQDGSLTLRQVAGTLGGSQARAQGRVLGLAENTPRVENLSLQVASPEPARLMRFFGATPPELVSRLGPTNAAANATGTTDRLAVEARAEAGGLELTGKGHLAQLLGAASGQMDVRARHANAAQVIRLFSPGYRPKGNLGAFALDAQVGGDRSAITLSNLALSAGAARLTGQARAELGGAKPQITADLAGNTLALDPFLAAERTGALLPGSPRVPPMGAPQSPTIQPAAAAAGQSPFSREPLDLSALNEFDARIGLKAEQVSAKGWRLDQPVAQLAVLNSTATVEQLTGKLLGGDMRMAAKLAGGATPALSGQLSVVGADLGAAKLGGGGISVTQGRFNLDTRFTTAGRSSQDMANRLAGDGKLLVSNGIIEGFDLPAVNQRINNIENVGSLLGVVQAGLSGGRTPFSQLAGTFRAENGVVASRDLKLDADGGGAKAEAIIDLPRWSTDTRIAFALANAPNTPLGIRFEGPLDNPRKIIDANALQQYLVSKGLGRALKGKDAGSVIEGLLGKGGQPAAPNQTPQQQQQSEQPREKNSGKAILQDLLKGLGGK